MKCEQLFAGKVQTLSRKGKEVKSAIFKSRLPEIHVHETGVLGDEQAYHGHGGPEKAICVYPVEHYPFWNEYYGTDSFGPSSFGENIAFSGGTERDIHVGDVYRIGTALVQACQTRPPCSKLDIRNNVNGLAQASRERGYVGFYLRVLEPGTIREGDDWMFVSRPEGAVSMHDYADLQFGNVQDKAALQTLLDTPELSEEAKKDLRKIK
ncbi:MOSC domain-containing protein [Ectobacillus ponti]|uniref:MOSC domain-containing protein n=1 Tax=Ectobacillus ponti TaxID=2961894 RepID=A0AA41X9U7_9BACI|nr:MOSC domain-containing protein [Ectobacillus ponti]MCP8969560.1 MOSC domain-containing protein [Ectobacillus ponti]